MMCSRGMLPRSRGEAQEGRRGPIQVKTKKQCHAFTQPYYVRGIRLSTLDDSVSFLLISGGDTKGAAASKKPRRT